MIFKNHPAWKLWKDKTGQNSLLSSVQGMPVRVWTENPVLNYWDLLFLHGAV